MKLHVLEYLFKEGCRNTWQNRLMALASAGVLICCLLLTGFSYLVFANVDRISQSAYEQNVIAVYLKSECTAEDANEAGRTIRSLPNVEKADFISKEELLQKYADDVVELYSGDTNPLPDTFIVSMKDLTLFDQTLIDIQNVDGVEEVSYDAGTAEVLTRFRRIVLVFGGSVIVLLLAVSLFIIVNTIKLTVHNRRLEIYIMKSVGATDGFVRFPFVVEGVLVGFAAAVVGYALTGLLYNTMVNNIDFGNPMLTLIPFSEVWGPLLVYFLLGGVLVGIIGSVISMGKYLRHEGGLR
ncbi:MAG: permease-like cell division protein FtsX [Clostridia bacterium]|nr:permease-like cell division protein FtsX [Clostridia bacterium]